MATVLDIVTAALRKCRVTGHGETPDADNSTSETHKDDFDAQPTFVVNTDVPDGAEVMPAFSYA